MFSNLDFGTVWRSLPYLFEQGMSFTLTLTAIATVLGIILGTLIAMMRLSSKRPLIIIGTSYVNLMRALPLVLVIFLFYFLMPYVGQAILRTDRPIQFGALSSTITTFTLFEAAYFSEIMRAGIQAIPRGQFSAGYAIGLNYREVMRYIVLPQAFRNMLPVLFTQTIVLFQDTSLVYAIGAYDLLKGFETAGKNLNRPVETYLLAALVYFVICFSLSMLVRRLQKRIAIIR